MSPLVSICVPVYGVEKYVERCCRSLFEQSYSNIEYIFVNDCTPDGSMEIIQQVLCDYPERKKNVKICNHQINKGLSGARNTAIQAAEGIYLMHVDSDDYLDLNVVECLVKAALENDADVVQYDMRYVYPNKQYIIHQQIPATKVECISDTLTYKMSVCVCGVLYETKLFKDNNLYFVEGLNFGEDYVTKPRILYYARKIVYCGGCYYNYVQYNASSYTLSYKPKNVEDLIKAIKILTDFFEIKSDYKIYKKAISNARLSVKNKLLIAICLHRKTLWNLFPQIEELDHGVDIIRSTLPLSYKIVLLLARYKWYNLLYLYVKTGYYIKQMKK